MRKLYLVVSGRFPAADLLFERFERIADKARLMHIVCGRQVFRNTEPGLFPGGYATIRAMPAVEAHAKSIIDKQMGELEAVIPETESGDNGRLVDASARING